MDIIQFLQKLFGNKSQRDMKLIQPFVEKIKAVYPTIDELDDDALRAKTKELQEKVQHSADDIKEKINELKGKVEETPIENRETIFTQIDKLEKDVLERFEKALDEVMPEAFSIVKSTARRFAENETIAVEATDFDRDLAATHDFVQIEGDKTTGWPAATRLLGIWCIMTCSCLVASFCTKVRLRKWQRVKEKRWWLRCRSSSMRSQVMVCTS